MTVTIDKATAIERILEKADKIGVFPTVAARIRQVANDHDASMVDLEEVVSLDPTLSAQILKLANSPFYGLNRTVGSLRHALMILGFRATRDLAMSLVVMRLTQGRDDVHTQLWTAGLRTGVAARLLARHVRWADPGEAFVTGILHDLGKLILLAVEEQRYTGMLQQHGNEVARLLQAERTVFGLTHTELGAACLKRWELPERLADAVEYHYDPRLLEDRDEASFQLTGLLWTAEQMERGLSDQRSFTVISEALAQHRIAMRLKLNAGVILDCLTRFEGAMNDTESTLY